MHYKTWLVSAVYCSAGALLGCSQSSPDISQQSMPSQKPMNVLMIAVDDLNNYVGVWGGDAITPNIDRLAAEGVMFQNAYAAVPACNPSRVAVLTGQRPEITGQYTNNGNFRHRPGGEDRVTLPQYLQRHGYDTIASGKIFHHSRGLKSQAAPLSDDRSWTYQSSTETGTAGAHEYVNEDGWAKWHGGLSEYDGLPIKDYIREHGIWGPIEQAKEQTGDFKTAQFCQDQLQQERDKPFFLACGIFRPHSPQLAPKEFFDLYPLEQIKLPELADDDMQDIPQIAQTNWSSGFARLVKSRPDEWRRAMQGYLASTSFADAAIGKMLTALENSDYKDNTIVVLWSDHGFQLGHKDRWEKFTMWRQGANAPMIIKVPGQAAKMVQEPVSLVDIYPTIVSLLDLPVGQQLSGHDLTPLLSTNSDAWPHAAVITYQQGNHGILRDHWNYIRYQDGTEELYDHRSDPNEQRNIVNQPSSKAIVQKMQQWIPDVQIPQDEYIPGG
ncbi:sulfatase [Echinimonas agarilytica]|uniref:Sulfatase n=1 Tax=Echinimonas agarilytica TaxID=1215918 RepID=A0AA41W5T3_9GAMM|nr:sulfatase [Echinimonas agarilytica]MCM2679063.1 sulfatase [Echinimonas agarilytica]